MTLIHRRLWPALVRLVDRLDSGSLDAMHEEHSDSGAHQANRIAFPAWVPREVMLLAQELSEEEAIAQLPAWVRDVLIHSGPTGS